MKRLTLTFLSLCFTAFPAIANIHINPDTVVTVTKQYVPADKVKSVILEYNTQIKASNGKGIAANRLWNVCAAAGWNVKESAGKAKCQTFVNALVKSSTVVFKEVCGADKGKTGATERCVTDFKNVKVNIGPAIAIAKEYARIKYNDASVQCFNKHRLSWNDDYVKCVSQNTNTFYEFQFDSVTESIDNIIKNGIQTAICSMHNAPAITAGCAGGGTNVSETMICHDASCTADAAKCGNINKSLAKFGYAATYKNNTCGISFETVSDRKSLRTAFGIDNFVFCSGIQTRNNQSTESYVKQYIASKAGVPITSVKCDAGFKTYTGPGCKVNGITDFKDDIKTCHVGKNVIDLVFDDINEKWTTYTNAADQAMACIINGGTYSGKKCIGLDKKMCDMVRNANAKSCPECKQVYWNQKTNTCDLPAGATATNLKKGLNYTAIVGGAVAGVIITIGTLGSATVPTSLVLTSLTIETLGAGIELTAQINIDNTADEFLAQAANCHDKNCAENLFLEYLAKMSNQQNDMLAEELTAADAELARLAELIPADTYFYRSMFANGTDLASNNNGDWTPAQVWRAVGITMQLTSVFSAVGNWILKETMILESKLSKTTIAITRKAKQVALANVVDYDKLDDIGKEWYRLWKKYAPNNQTFDEFKAMTNGNLDEMKKMTRDWEGLGKGEAYSTYDPKMSQAFREYQAKSDELSDWWSSEFQKRYRTFSDNGGVNWFDSDEYKVLLAEYNEKFEKIKELAPTQWDIGNEFQLKNLENVINERVQVMDDIIASNPDIKSKLTKKVWSGLSNEEKLNVAQQILDEYAARLGTPKAKVVIEEMSDKWGGYYTPGTNIITLNPEGQLKDAKTLTEILSHEYGHLIDDMTPNQGALGAQYSNFSSSIYSSEIEEGYRVALTEQSSFAIGNATGKVEDSMSKGTKDGTINIITTTVPVASTAAGIEVGVLNQLAEDRK